MNEDILKLYLPDWKFSRPFTVIDDVEMDAQEKYGFYLLANGDDRYILAEVPYSYISSAVSEIDHLFPVDVQGWYKPLRSQDAQGEGLLRPDFFKRKDGEVRRMYDEITVKHEGMRYALLSVRLLV